MPQQQPHDTKALAPLETLYDAARGTAIELPPELAALYGDLWLSPPAERPLVFANFVSTLDGVVALDEPGYEGGGAISGFNRHDKAVMGLLRAVSDAVVVGAGTLRSVPKSIWTAESIFPPLAGAYAALRTALGKPAVPLNVIVTARGTVDLALPVFASGKVPALIVTTPEGAARLAGETLPPSVGVAAGHAASQVSAGDVLDAVRAARPNATAVLVEGGPHLMAAFFNERLADELFLTLAPQAAGRDAAHKRFGLVEGALYLPEHPLKAALLSVKRSQDHLFLRYDFAADR
ncbi:MAG: dihydrofolate reductase family protein [Ktedonobacterales bacterium]